MATINGTNGISGPAMLGDVASFNRERLPSAPVDNPVEAEMNAVLAFAVERIAERFDDDTAREAFAELALCFDAMAGNDDDDGNAWYWRPWEDVNVGDYL